MDTNFYQGKLKHWDDDKGFGFIEQRNGKDIFIHISSLKRMSRRPVVGDIIHYQIHTEKNGKNRAVNAKIEGVSESQLRLKEKTKMKKTKKNKTTYGLVYKVFIFIFLGLVSLIIYNKFFSHVPAQNSIEPLSFPTQNPIEPLSFPKKEANYSCSGKVYCSEMTSCEEATFYQNNCSGTKMDGDGDGIPCERQWCN